MKWKSIATFVLLASLASAGSSLAPVGPNGLAQRGGLEIDPNGLAQRGGLEIDPNGLAQRGLREIEP